ncbi:MAG: MgtC/SapB family protein [Candidatus Yanofskybacteria bacterium]|nr:MgtC/SapB family protein [Candidatus Yanofskybacteria bacterium]
MFESVIIIKVAVAALLGAVVGFERELARKVAGIRTHALVCLASALFTSISVDAFKEYVGTVGYDPSRIISNIIVGIGFIGAGAILRHGSKVEGTTTAASLWAIAAIGVTVGVGLFKEAVVITALIYAVLYIVWFIEQKMRKKFGAIYKTEEEEFRN